MKSKLIALEVNDNELHMLREFVEYVGIEFYDHADVLYKLLDRIADETVRIYAGEDIHMQEEIKDLIWEFYKDGSRYRSVHKVILDHVKEEFKKRGNNLEAFYYNFDKAIEWMLAKKYLVVDELCHDVRYRFVANPVRVETYVNRSRK